jgi:hypothetical protein
MSGIAKSDDDFVDDTPREAGPSMGKGSAFSHVTCNNGSNDGMFMNYMDYTDAAGCPSDQQHPRGDYYK